MQTDGHTEEGSHLDFHVPLNRALLESFDMKKVNWIGVCAVLQKTSDKEFQMPYQNALLSKKQNNIGFNRLFFKDPPSYGYVPVFDMNRISGTAVLNELIRRIKGRVGLK